MSHVGSLGETAGEAAGAGVSSRERCGSADDSALLDGDKDAEKRRRWPAMGPREVGDQQDEAGGGAREEREGEQRVGLAALLGLGWAGAAASAKLESRERRTGVARSLSLARRSWDERCSRCCNRRVW